MLYSQWSHNILNLLFPSLCVCARVCVPQNSFNAKDFADLSAPLLYNMFKAHTEFPLHLAIQHQREDVVFLFLIEYNSQVGTHTMYVHVCK